MEEDIFESLKEPNPILLLFQILLLIPKFPKQNLEFPQNQILFLLKILLILNNSSKECKIFSIFHLSKLNFIKNTKKKIKILPKSFEVFKKIFNFRFDLDPKWNGVVFYGGSFWNQVFGNYLNF
jgi:hypothetical protein